MKTFKILLLFLTTAIGLFNSLHGQIQRPAYNATAVLNKFISENAAKYPEWQRDILIEQGNVSEVSRRITPPRRVGVSPVAGVYSYRAVTWGELSNQEKLDILKNPELLSWVSWYNSRGKVTLPNRIGTSLSEQAQNLAGHRSTISHTQNKQVVMPPIEKTPYYTEVIQANSRANQAQMERDAAAYNRYAKYIQTLRDIAGQKITPEQSLQQIYNMPAYASDAQQTQNTNTTQILGRVPAQSNMYVPRISPAYNEDPAYIPEYTEILKLREQLLSMGDQNFGAVPQVRALPTTPNSNSSGSVKLAPIVPVSSDMGKYNINITKGELYSEDPLYFQLSANKD